MSDIKYLPLNTFVTTTRKDDKHFLDKVNTNIYEIGWYDMSSWELCYLVTAGHFNLKENNLNKLLASSVLYYDEETWRRLEAADYVWDDKKAKKRI